MIHVSIEFMKVALNITREPLAGITSTNLNLLDSLHGSNTFFTGIELNSFRRFKSPIVYRHLSPDWFDHNIISISDFSIGVVVKKSRTLKDVEKQFTEIIEHVRSILQREKPDVLLVNGTYYIPWILSIAAQKEKIPIVLWYAGILSREVATMTPHYRKIFYQMERSIIKRADKIIFPSSICKETVLKEVSRLPVVKKGQVIPNPISPLFTRASKIELSVERRIAFVGRFTAIKNIEAFFAIHKLLLKQGWKHEATIVSDISKKNISKIPKSVKIIPSMSNDELKTFYATQGLIISPSTFETFGNVPIEAVSIGIPVLVSNTMGCADILSESGLEKMVIDFTDIKNVAQSVIELCGQHVLPRQINNVRKRVDIKYVASEITAVLRESANIVKKNNRRFRK